MAKAPKMSAGKAKMKGKPKMPKGGPMMPGKPIMPKGMPPANMPMKKKGTM